MIEGKPLFMGLCEIDQLFQIFFKMGTPTADNWPTFLALPNFQPQLFPQWTENQLYGLMKNATEDEYKVLLSMLCYDPALRASAHEILQHRYFARKSRILLHFLVCNQISFQDFFGIYGRWHRKLKAITNRSSIRKFIRRGVE
jgi:serine/threonine protein kinase